MEEFLVIVKRLNYEELTKHEKRLVDFIIENTNMIVEQNLRIEKLSEQSKTGYSAIYSLMKKLNINGYKELLLSLKMDLENQIKTKELIEEKEIKTKYLDYLQKNYETNVCELSKTRELIKNAKRVYIVHWNYGFYEIAREMKRTIYKINERVYVCDKDEINSDSLKENIKKGDLFIIYTNHTYKSTRFSTVCENIVKNEGKIVYIGNRNPEKELIDFMSSKHVVVPIITNDNKEYSKYVFYAFINDLIIAGL